MTMRFAKYHGIGNDFLVVDLRGGDPPPSPQDPTLSRALCDRRFGVGGDGVLAILPSSAPGADARMRVLNADGSEAEMCGNGIRCVAKHLYERDPVLRRDVIRIETLAGVHACGIHTGAGGEVEQVSVEMGRPRLTRREIPMSGGPAPREEPVASGGELVPDDRCLEQPLTVAGETFRITAVSMGNPHAVAFVEGDPAALRALAERHGPAIETHAWFPKKTNVEIAHSLSPTRIDLVVWERGVGITLACGTGACATAVAACLTGRAQPGQEVTVRLLGGDLAITVAPDYSGVTMRGPARLVYEGEVDLSSL